MARVRMDSECSEPPLTWFFSWDEITSTPRPTTPKIPAHDVWHSLKSGGTPCPSMLKKKKLMAELFSATSSGTILEQMSPSTPIAKGLVCGENQG